MTDSLTALPLPAWVDPARVHRAVFSAERTSFWLDAGPDATDGWSIVGSGRPEEDPDVVRDVPLVVDDAVGAPWEAGPFRGGWVGWLSYEEGAERAGAPVADSDPEVPAQCWLRASEWIAFDHADRRAWAVAPAARVAELARRATGASRAVVEDADAAPDAAAARRARARHLPTAYAALIEDCRDAIREGDAYQLCLTTRFDVPDATDPIEAYERLRASHPTHHGGLVRCGDAALASSTPERFLTVEGGVVSTSPIKGTRPRGATPGEDAALAEQLRRSPKERAENIMIVDLMRNDLSRVCVPGSVAVEGLLEIESYPAVHQLVSTVSGRIAREVTVGDLVDATFPAGSMTGTPKLSAMTILHDLEGGARGVFAGCFGWVGVDGRLDLAMVIRSIVFHPGGAYVGAGGGITWRSSAAEEVEEVGIKARGPLAALGVGLPPGW